MRSTARPVAAVGSAEKLELPRSLGAVEAVTYEEIGELEPVDVVFDLVGGDVFAELARPPEADGHGDRGRLRRRDVAGRSSPAWLVGRNIGVHGFYLGRLIGRDPELVARAAKDVLELWEGGAVRPVVGAEFPLEEAAEAHRLIEIPAIDRKGRTHSMTALVTGSAGGIGARDRDEAPRPRASR